MIGLKKYIELFRDRVIQGLSLEITAEVANATTIVYTLEIAQSAQSDVDSIVNNNNK